RNRRWSWDPRHWRGQSAEAPPRVAGVRRRDRAALGLVGALPWIGTSMPVGHGSTGPVDTLGVRPIINEDFLGPVSKHIKMLRITKLTDYAVLVLADMVRPDVEDARAARDVAERTRIPQPTVSKVLKLLARSQLVFSERGKNGGYRIARPPDAISVAD